MKGQDTLVLPKIPLYKKMPAAVQRLLPNPYQLSRSLVCHWAYSYGERRNGGEEYKPSDTQKNSPVHAYSPVQRYSELRNNLETLQSCVHVARVAKVVQARWQKQLYHRAKGEKRRTTVKICCCACVCVSVSTWVNTTSHIGQGLFFS